MKQVTVISGKGGTGKTSLVGAFASLAQRAVLADCDVDAANLHLLICDRHSEEQPVPFMSGSRASVDRHRCTGCGWCEEACRFDAIHLEEPCAPDGPKAIVDPLSCEGCGVCSDGCPSSAVVLRDRQAGELLVTPSRFGTLVHARLRPGEGSSGKLVTKVRTLAGAAAREAGAELVLIDGSPGIGCPVIASITGVDGVLVVTEPTMSGKSDLERVLELCRHFGLPACVLVNKYDLNEQAAESIGELCREEKVPLLGRVRFDPSFVDALVGGKTIMELDGNGTALEVSRIWSGLLQFLDLEAPAAGETAVPSGGTGLSA